MRQLSLVNPCRLPSLRGRNVGVAAPPTGELAPGRYWGYVPYSVRLICHLLVNEFKIPRDIVERGINEAVLYGGSVLTHLIDAGVDEKIVLDALSKRFGLPSADLRDHTLPDTLLGVLPKAVMSKHRMIPLEKKGQTLKVAVGDARDRIGLSEATQISGCMIKPHIALESRLEACLRKYVDPELQIDILTVPASNRRIATLAEATKAFAAAEKRDEVADILVRFLLSGFSRATIFVNRKGMLQAWRAGRRALSSHATIERWLGDSALRALYVPLNQPSTFVTVVENKSPLVGKLGTGRVEKFFLDTLGESTGLPCLLAPILAFGRVVNVIYADGEESPTATQMSDYMLAMHHAREAYERLVRDRLKATA